jgi:hypothetical protein
MTRRVIDTVWLDLRVEDVSQTASQLQTALSEVEGYVADSQLRPTQHSGQWTVRIPQDRLESFLTAAQQWGVVLSSRTTAEDVTEQFIDVEARQKAKHVEETRLLKLLEEQAGTLADVLAVEQQLHRVREEIEQADGRMRYLEHATRYATVHVAAHELFGESWSDGRQLGSQAATVFRNSCQALLLCGRAAVLVLAALAPWFALAAVTFGPLWWLWRWRRREKLVTVEVRGTKPNR